MCGEAALCGRLLVLRTGLPAPIDLEPDQYKEIDFFITAKASKEKRDCTLRDPNVADP